MAQTGSLLVALNGRTS